MNFNIRSFRRHYHRVREAYDAFETAGDFGFTLHYDGVTAKLSSKLDTPASDATIRFIMLMRRLLDPAEPLYYRNVWGALREQFADELPAEFIHAIDDGIENLNAGSIGFNVNGEDVSAERVYTILADAEYFGQEDKARAYLKTLMDPAPMGPFVWWQFYEYNVQACRLVSAIFGAILQVEKSAKFKTLYGEPDVAQNRCIYCLRTGGGFTSDEHIVPESLGNLDYLVLPPGYVCDECNNGILAQLDKWLIRSPAIAPLRVLYVPYDKEGHLPKASLGNMTIERTGPRQIRITSKDRTGGVRNVRELGDDEVTFEINMQAGGFKPQRLARSLYKIALGMVALDQGQDTACDSRYNAARDFILNGHSFPNNLLMTTTLVPKPQSSVYFDPRYPGTPVIISLFGVAFILNLEEAPLVELTEQLQSRGFTRYPLGG